MIKLILLSVLLVPGMAFAQAFSKWTDENGQVHYGDRPPIDDKVDAKAVYIKPNTVERDGAYSDYYQKRADSYDDYMQKRGTHQNEMDEKRFDENKRRYEESQARQRDRDFDNYHRQKAADEQRRKEAVRRRHSTGQR